MVFYFFSMALLYSTVGFGGDSSYIALFAIQPFLTLLASIFFLGESVLWSTWVIATLVALCIFGDNRERIKVPVQ